MSDWVPYAQRKAEQNQIANTGSPPYQQAQIQQPTQPTKPAQAAQPAMPTPTAASAARTAVAPATAAQPTAAARSASAVSPAPAQPPASQSKPAQTTPTQDAPDDAFFNVIGNIHGKNVVMDMRLQMELPQGYSVYGKHTKVVVSATETKAGGNVYVTATLPPHLPFAIRDAATRYAYAPVISQSARPAVDESMLKSSVDSMTQLVDYLRSMLRSKNLPQTAEDSAELVKYLGSSLAGVLSNLNSQVSGEAVSGDTPPEFQYTEAHPRPYKTRFEDGVEWAAVQSVSIVRRAMRNGTPAKYPWTFTIGNAEAPLRRSENGMVQYDGQRLRNKKEVTINATDADILALTVKACLLIQTYVNVTSAPLIKKYESEKEARRNSQ